MFCWTARHTNTDRYVYNTCKISLAYSDVPSYGQYCTRIVGGVLFHSVAGSNMTSHNLSAGNYNMLGQPASHGVTPARDAKWIYDNCALGTTVTISDTAAMLFDKPATIKIPAGQDWDPTDLQTYNYIIEKSSVD